MTDHFEFDRLDGFVPGVVGQPGDRTFYLQARIGNQVVAFKMEKEQVALLGRYLAQEIMRHGGAEPDRDVTGLVEPVAPKWAIGNLSAAFDAEAQMIHITAEELIFDDDLSGGFEEDFPDDSEEEFDDEFEDDEVSDGLAEQLEELLGLANGRTARFVITLGQAAAFAEMTEELIAGGRPPCRLCGRPMEPGGHDCPRWN